MSGTGAWRFRSVRRAGAGGGDAALPEPAHAAARQRPLRHRAVRRQHVAPGAGVRQHRHQHGRGHVAAARRAARHRHRHRLPAGARRRRQPRVRTGGRAVHLPSPAQPLPPRGLRPLPAVDEGRLRRLDRQRAHQRGADRHLDQGHLLPRGRVPDPAAAGIAHPAAVHDLQPDRPVGNLGGLGSTGIRATSTASGSTSTARR